MKPLIPTPYELGREAADKQEAALVKQAIADRTADKQRIRELEATLRKFGSGWHIEFNTGKYFCHICGNEKAEGHADSCPFEHATAILKGAK